MSSLIYGCSVPEQSGNQIYIVLCHTNHVKFISAGILNSLHNIKTISFEFPTSLQEIILNDIF